MKQISTPLSIVALLAVGILYFLHFSHSEKLQQQITKSTTGGDSAHFRIAYFDIDTLQSNYDKFKDAEGQLKTKENSIKSQLSDLQYRYQKRLKELQDKAQAQNMTQSEADAAQRELSRMQQEFQQKEVELDQEMKKLQMDLMTELHENVEAFLKVYNTNKGYAYIFSYQPGVMIYYKDSMYDITTDIIKGLNEEYKKVKKKP